MERKPLRETAYGQLLKIKIKGDVFVSIRFFKKSMIATLMGVFLLLSSLSSISFADSQKSITVPTYIEYLKNFSVEDALLSGVTDPQLAKESSENASRELDKFLALTSEDQQTFIDIINNPTILSNIYSGNLDKLGSYEKYVTYSTSVTTESTEVPLNSRALTKEVEHEGVLGLFGLDLAKYRVTGIYSYNSSGAIEDLSTKGKVVQNYNPTVDTNLTWYNGYVNNGIYHGDVTFDYKIGIQGVGGLQMGNVNLGVTGDQNGKRAGYFYTD
jgi:hypothetical protein